MTTTISTDIDVREAGLSGLPGGRGLNIGYEAVDRHVDAGRATAEALRFITRKESMTYGELRARTNQFAGALEALGLQRGERVYTLLGRVPELYVTALGTLKAGHVFSPLFSAFGPEPIAQRMNIGEGRVLVTTKHHYERKVAAIRDQLPALAHVLIVGDVDRPPPGTASFDALVDAQPDDFTVAATGPEDLALLHFTSGTTGTPKGAMHVHRAVIGHHTTGAEALDLRSDDVFWCTADPGWVTGTSYGIVSPLTHGATVLVDEEEFDAERWYATLDRERVTVWYTSPTAVRMLMRAGDDLPRDFDLSAVRFVASVGEPLHHQAVEWGRDVLGCVIHDNWWQTETGGIMIANVAGAEVRPGSMGRPLRGIVAAVVARTPDGEPAVDDANHLVPVGDDEQGELVLRPGWPSMFRGYLHDEERYARCFRDGWYLTGDLVRRDRDGYFWFAGRGDDVIKSSGHLIGPFEVERVLMRHPAVLEAGVVGKPDPVAGEVVKAFVSLRPGQDESDDLRLDILAFARRNLGPTVAPREIDFAANLPKTKSGKILRRLLKARELGLPEGDTSTLEDQ